MTEILPRLVDLGDSALILILLIIVWWKLDRRIIRLEILIKNDLNHRLKTLEKLAKSEDEVR